MNSKDLYQTLATPTGAILAVGALVGGWGIGSAMGHGYKNEDVFGAEPGGETSDWSEFTTFVGMNAGVAVTWSITSDIIKKYGLQKLALYTVAWVAVVAVGRGIRNA